MEEEMTPEQITVPGPSPEEITRMSPDEIVEAFKEQHPQTSQQWDAVTKVLGPIVQKRISHARMQLIHWHPFFGFLVTHGDPVVSHQVPTAGVTPKGKMLFNPIFSYGLSQEELRGVLCHEIMHPAYLCFQRRKGRDMRRWNIAHDHAINLLILEEVSRFSATFKVQLPEGALHDPKYKGWSAEEIYDDQDLQCPKDFKVDLCGGNTPDPMDGDRWKAVVVAAAEAARKRGREPCSEILELVDAYANPKLDWQSELTRWLGENGPPAITTYSRLHRRSDIIGEMLPSTKAHLPEILLLWDTSGSMSSDHQGFLADFKALIEDYGEVRVVTCDTEVHGDFEVSELSELVLEGNGGSNFVPAFEHMEEEGFQGVVIALTDGFIGVPQEEPDFAAGVLWCLVPGGTPPAEWGTVLEIPAD